MTHSRIRPLLRSAVLLVLAAGCQKEGTAPVSKSEQLDLASLPPVASDAPPVGAIVARAAIRDEPRPSSRELGYLRSGERVPAQPRPVATEGCPGGWLQVYPRGFVCGDEVSTDLSHPTLAIMALQPKLDEQLPYTYARTRSDTPLFERASAEADAVKASGLLPKQSGMAIVGSWRAQTDGAKEERLGMTTEGRFLRADDLRSAKASSFQGVVLSAEHKLPVAFVLKRGVAIWKLDGSIPKKDGELDFHAQLALTGRYRTVGPDRFLATTDDRWVRNQDVTSIQARSSFPDFVKGAERWLDVSIVAGTLVAYEGKTPQFATLVSTGRDRLEEAAGAAVTKLGDFQVVAKEITAVGLDPKLWGDGTPLADPPWVLELSSGQRVLGAYWHERFGIEHGPGNVEMSPADARWVWHWASPALPTGWHGIRRLEGSDEAVTWVRIRK